MLRRLRLGETPNALAWNALVEQLRFSSGPFIAAPAPSAPAPSATTPDIRPRGVEFRNDSDFTVPAYGVLQLVGFSTADGHRALLADRPGANFSRHYAANGPSDVPSGQYGICFLSGVVEVLYDSGTPAIGESFGPQAAQWSVAKDLPGGFSVLGIVDASQQVMACQLEPPRALIGQLIDPLDDGLPAQVELWSGPAAAETALAGPEITAFNWTIPSGVLPVPAGTRVVCEWINSTWYVTAIR